MDDAVKAKVGDSIQFVFRLLDGTATLPARIVGISGNEVRAQFVSLSLQEDEALTMLLYSRADAWLGLGGAREADKPLRSMGRILRLSMRGFWHMFGGSRSRKEPTESKLVIGIAPVILLGLLAGVSGQGVRAAQADHVVIPAGHVGAADSTQNVVPPAAAGTFDNVFTMSDAGVPSAITLHGVDASHSIYFSVARNRLVKTATLKLRYHLSPGLLPGVSHLNVSLNGTMFASLAAAANPSSGDPRGCSKRR